MSLNFDPKADYMSITREAIRSQADQEWTISFSIPKLLDKEFKYDPLAVLEKQISSGLVEIKVIGTKPVCVPTDAWLKTNYFPVGEVYLEPNVVYDCPKHGDEAVEFLYGLDSVFITAKTLQDLVKSGQITISEK